MLLPTFSDRSKSEESNYPRTNHLSVLELQVIRGKDNAVVMASQIEDDFQPKPKRGYAKAKTEWTEEGSSAGRKLDLVPSYDEIMSAVSSSSQPTLTSPPRRKKVLSSGLISQSQPSRPKGKRAPFCNTQTTSIADLDDLDEITECKQLYPYSPIKKSQSEYISSKER